MLSHQRELPNDAVVFVIDDDSSLRTSLRRLINSAGWSVESYASAQEFFDHEPSESIGCVLLDLQMPGLDGLRAYEHMRELGFRMPVVFLTGHGDVPSSVAAMKQGAADFLQKPVDDEALLRSISSAVTNQLTIRNTNSLKAAAEQKLSNLSRREREVLHGVLLGKLNKQIAGDLGIAEKTVKVHRGRVMSKTGARTVAGLVLMCADAGMHPPHG